jgi:hypothetical protein
MDGVFYFGITLARGRRRGFSGGARPSATGLTANVTL